MTTREEVAKKLNLTHVTTEQFWKVCPIPMAELLSKNNKQEIVVWRNLGMLVFWLNGCTTSHAGRQFNKSHSSVISSKYNVINAKHHHNKLQVMALEQLLGKENQINWNADK